MAPDLQALIELSVPEGWQLVPVNPTDEMIDAFMDEEVRISRLPANTFLPSPRADKYRAMLAAAPKPPTNSTLTAPTLPGAGGGDGLAMVALKAWDQWDYEVESAKANGESIYSYHDFAVMRKTARDLTAAALPPQQGG